MHPKCFQPKGRLSKEEISTSLENLTRDGMCSQTMTVLAGGPILIAFALALGADNAYIGAIAALPFLAQFIQIPAIYLVEKTGNRKLLSFISATFSRIFIGLIAALPFLSISPLTALFLILALHYILANIANTAWNSWMRELVPLRIRGTVYARRMRRSTALSALFAVAAGLYLDRAGTVESYSIVLIVAFAFGMVSSLYISRIHEPRMHNNGFTYRTLLEPFHDSNFRNLMIFIATWSLAANMVLPFLAVYMYKELGLGVATVMALTVVSQFSSVYFLRSLGELSDRYGNKPVIALSGSVFALSIFLWTFTTFPGPHRFTLPLLLILHVLLGLAIGGINLGTLNIGAKLSPVSKSTSYLASLALVTALFSGLGAIISGHMLDFFLRSRLSLMINWSDPERLVNLPILDFTGYDFHFLIAVIIALLSLHRLVFVTEEGEASPRVVRHELLNTVLKDIRGLTVSNGTSIGMPLLNLRVIYSPIICWLKMVRRKRGI